MLNGWNQDKCIQLRLDHTKVAEDLDNFPVKLNLGSTSGQNNYDATALFNELEYTMPTVNLTNVDDDFSGADESIPNDLLWTNLTTTAVRIRNNKLNHTSSSASDVNNQLFSVFTISGDFDIQMDYDIVTMTQPASSVQYLGFRIYDSNYVSWNMGRIYSSGGSQEYYVDGGTTPTAWTAYTTTDTIGKQRFVRTGSTLKTYLWSNGQWEWNGNTSGYTWSDCPSGPIYVVFLTKQESNASLNVNIDNFKVNSGTITWPQCLETFQGDDGDSPNTILWAEGGSALVTKEIRNNSYYVYSYSPNNLNAILVSKFKLSGNFDIQLDTTITKFTIPSSSGSYVPWFAVRFNNGTNWVSVSFASSPSYYNYRFTSDIYGTSTSVTDSFTADKLVRLRLVRAGSTIYGYYWNGTSWADGGDWSLSATTGDADILININQDFDSEVECYVDNIQINSGTIVWPIEYFPNRKKIAIYDPGHQEHMVETVDDSFTGTNGNSPNSLLWTVTEAGTHTVNIQSNKLRFDSNASTAANSNALAKYKLSGDFDFEVDFSNLTMGTVDNNYFFIRPEVDGNNFVDFKVGRVSGADKFRLEGIVGGVYWGAYESARSYNFGSMRITRENNVLSFYLKDGTTNTWTLLNKNTSFPTSDCVFRLWLTSQTGSDVYGDYDNFKLNYGTLNWDGNTPNYELKSYTGIAQQCYCEIENWDQANQEAQLWIKIPKLLYAQPTDLYLYYDSTQDDNLTYIGNTGETAGENVWDDDFLGVYHMNKYPTGTLIDSTHYDNDGTSGGTMTVNDLVDGLYGKAIDFDGGDDYIGFGDIFDPGLYPELTVEVLFNGPNYTNVMFVASKGNNTSTVEGWSLVFEATSLYLRCNASNDTSQRASVHYTGLINNNTYDACLVLDRTENKIKGSLNGSRGIFDVGGGGPSSDDISSFDIDTAYEFRIASSAGTASYMFDGIIGEVRVSNIARSEYWLRSSYYSKVDNIITYSPAYMYHVTGYVKQDNVPVQRKVYLYNRANGQLMDSTISDSSGYYYLKTTSSDAHNVVCIDDDAGNDLEDLIASRVYPSS